MTTALFPSVLVTALAATLAGLVAAGLAPPAPAAFAGAGLAAVAAWLPRRRPAPVAEAAVEAAVEPAEDPAPPAPEPIDDGAAAALAAAAAILREGALERRVGGPAAAEIDAALEAVQSAMDEALALADMLSRGDLTVWESDAHTGRFGELVSSLGHVAGGLRSVFVAAQAASSDVEAQSGDLSGRADALKRSVDSQSDALGAARQSVEGVRAASAAVRDSAADGDAAAARAAEAAAEGRAEADAARSAAADVSARSREIAKLLVAVSSVAQQTKLLGVNASVEAARAGEAGRGFAVVAAEVQALAGRSGETAKEIERQLGENDAAVAECARVIASGADLLGRIETEVAAVAEASTAIREACAEQGAATDALVDKIGAATQSAAEALDTAAAVNGATRALDGAAAKMSQSLQGALLEEVAMVEAAQTRAAQIAGRMAAALDAGRLSLEDLFTDDFTLIEDTDPPQYMAPYVPFMDDEVRPILESAYALGAHVAFAAATTTGGYVPTHNAKFSKPQGADPVANAAFSRNRRFFSDRVGLASGRSTAPSLIQAYRRDMGGGRFVTIKNVSAPIMVRGRHWGGLRIGYSAREQRLGAAA